ncbi:hypothetical protein HWV23_13265 [Natronomonas halophila]|uniref:DUF7322 domain-containing protein n=1 Tax=Natronomonas halophila TaxID=2747817 RepID=UPI0015B548C6|nr:hypothetical protein [Natronomonas halophila]QLD86654.1 hypothetical protein HWV23_13265 [Natronomonas halophila]
MNPLEDEEEEAWPDEPEGFDPEDLGPDTPDPTANVDSRVKESLGATADMEEGLFRAFWGAVVFLNTALAALSIGAMLVYFRGDWAMGGPALLVGSIAAVFTVRFYLKGKRKLRERDERKEETEDTEDTEESDIGHEEDTN